MTKYDESVYYKILGFKLFAVTFFSLLYDFYYGGGDTFGFFAWSARLVEYFFEHPDRAIDFIFATDVGNFYAFKFSKAIPNYHYLLKLGTRELFFVKIMFFVNLIGLNTYLAVSYLLTLFSFIANWLLYKVFVQKYPAISKKLVVSVMLIPSVAFWGGGVLKDTLAFIGICVIVYAVNQIFIAKNKRMRNFIILIFFSYLIISLRGFVILSLLPAVILWIFLDFNEGIESSVLRVMATPFLLMISIGIIILMLFSVGGELDRFSVDQLDNTIKDFQGWHEIASADGSGYSLHVSGSSPLEMLKAFPAGINVTFFRPYLWEANGAVVLFSSVEALILLIYFIRVFIVRGMIFRSISIILSEPLVQLCLIFACLYGFSVGFTSYNFGALSRYKIPAMPFFVTMLVIINYRLNVPKTAKK